MIFNNGKFMGADYTDDQLRAIAASRAAAASVGVRAAEAQGTQNEQATAAAMDHASLVASIVADERIKRGGYTKWLVYGSIGLGAAGFLYLIMRKPKPVRMHSRPKKS